PQVCSGSSPCRRSSTWWSDGLQRLENASWRLQPSPMRWRRAIKMRNRVNTRSRAYCAGIFGVALLLSGCTVGPNYRRPAVQAPMVFRGPDQSQQSEAQSASFADLPWWQLFHDPQLQELIRAALKQNYDLQMAVERVNAARAQLGITRSNQFPQVTLDPVFSGGKTDQNIKSNIFSLAADVVFHVDLFGDR